jgi:hypothetical protein
MATTRGRKVRLLLTGPAATAATGAAAAGGDDGVIALPHVLQNDAPKGFACPLRQTEYP